MKKTIFIFLLWAGLMVAEAGVLMGKIPFPTSWLWTLPVGNLISLVVIGRALGWAESDPDNGPWSDLALYVFGTASQGLTIFGLCAMVNAFTVSGFTPSVDEFTGYMTLLWAICAFIPLSSGLVGWVADEAYKAYTWKRASSS